MTATDLRARIVAAIDADGQQDWSDGLLPLVLAEMDRLSDPHREETWARRFSALATEIDELRDERDAVTAERNALRSLRAQLAAVTAERDELVKRVSVAERNAFRPGHQIGCPARLDRDAECRCGQ
jgi:hypothetical protein